MRILLHRLAFALVVLCVASGVPVHGGQAVATQQANALHIPFQKYTLANGLTVVLAEDHATPMVSVVVMYHVGSKNEEIGRTGFAHLFEHMMFTGSGHVPYGMHDKFTEGVGGNNNAGTDFDYTVYYQSVPSNFLEHVLWLESDRQGWLLDALDAEKFNAQRDIVKNERRQSVDNRPYGRVDEIMGAAIYPPNHPYSWPVIGSMTDLSAASVEDVKKFFRLFYAPNNATLVVSGHFDPATAKPWIEKYFNDVPHGAEITRPHAPPVTLQAEKRLVYEDRVKIPQLFLQWPTVGVRDDDNRVLDILASVLTGSRTARLTKALVYDHELASKVTANQATNESVGDFRISVTPRPGHSLAELKAACDPVLEALKKDGPTPDELQRAKADVQFAFVSSLESNLGKAFQLATGQTYFDDPGYAFSVDFPAYQRVTAEDIKRVANKFLGAGRVVLSVVPIGQKSAAASADAALVPPVKMPPSAPAAAPPPAPSAPAAQAPAPTAASHPSSFDRTVVPTPGPAPEIRVPSWTRTTLPNGMQLVVSERHALPLVSVAISFLGGADQFEPAGKTGAAALVAGMLPEGTTTKTGDQIADAAQAVGSNLESAVGAEDARLGFASMTSGFEPMLDLTADVTLHPTFPAPALERRRANLLVQLAQARDSTRGIAEVVFPKVVYSTDHPYGRSATESTVKAITRDDLLAFKAQCFQPSRAIVTVVGDISAADAQRQVERAFGSWTGQSAGPVSFAYRELPEPRPTTIYLVDKPGAAQSTFAIGSAGPPRKTPDYYAIRVMNSFFGEQFQSRLNANIREEKGYSYGVGSHFAFGRGPGPFRAGGEIVTASSDKALVEFMKEFNGIRGARPITDDEMTSAKNALIQALPAQFGSNAGIGRAISALFLQDLPEDYFQQFPAAVRAVTKDEVVRAAQRYIDPAHLAIVIVGDRKQIEGPLKATGIAPLVLLDTEGNPVTESSR
jgi:zinc protease